MITDAIKYLRAHRSYLFGRGSMRYLFRPKVWTKTSESFYKTLKSFFPKNETVLEAGSSTGHISCQLAREGYDVTLLDIRPEAVIKARKLFGKTKAKFIAGDLFKLNSYWGSIWCSGLIQCYPPEKQRKMIEVLSSHSKRLLLFYPDTNDPRKVRGANPNSIPGVSDAIEYDVRSIPDYFYEHYQEIFYGILSPEKTAVDFDMLWILGKY